MKPGRITIKATDYRGKPGFSIRGKVSGSAFPASVFTKTREGAEAVKAALKRGDHDEVDRILRAGR